MKLFRELEASPRIHKEWERDSQASKNMMRIRQVYMTPTLVVFKPCMKQQTNRIIRYYHEHVSRFLRVRLTTDYLSQDYYFSDSKKCLLGNVHKNLSLGFSIPNGEKFKFIGYSNSQLKANSCWFFSEKALTEDQMISTMGNFDEECKLLKKYARRGQCFSTTSFVQCLAPSKISIIPDIERNDFCFTDGCGNINPLLAIKVARTYGMSYTSAIQIRRGGAKGVVMIKPHDW